MLNTKSFLVLEHDEVNALLLRSILEKQGCKVTVVSSASQAEAELDKGSFDALIMETIMIQADPNGFIARLKESPARSEMKIVVITSDQVFFKENAEVNQLLDACLLKPIDISNTLQEITSLFLNRNLKQLQKFLYSKDLLQRQCLSMN